MEGGAMANGELDVYAVGEVLGFLGMNLSLTSLTLAMNLIVLSYACQIAPVLKALSLVVLLMAVMSIATTATWALGPKELTIKGIAGMAILTLMSLQALYLYRTKVTGVIGIASLSLITDKEDLRDSWKVSEKQTCGTREPPPLACLSAQTSQQASAVASLLVFLARPSATLSGSSLVEPFY